MRKQHAEHWGPLRRLEAPLVIYILDGLPGHHVSLRVPPEDPYDACHGAQATHGIYSVSDPSHTTVASFRSPLL